MKGPSVSVPTVPASPVTLLLWACLVLLLVGLLLLIAYLIWQARRNARKDAGGPETEGKETREGEINAQSVAGELPATFTGALDILRARAPGTDFRYTIPWILMLGPANSGKSSLLTDSNLSTLVEEQVTLEQGAGFTWNFFDHGLLIDVGGWAMSSAAPAAAAWKRLLRLFLNNRPGRPLDGIVLTIPVNDLTGPNALSSSALIERGALLQQRLRQITQTLMFQLPVYVLLTKCDAIPGFSDYAAELSVEELTQIFGWSRPENDLTAFHPEWVDEALDTMRVALELRQGQLFAEHAPGPSRGEMFLFPGELFSLTPALRLLLGRAMRGSEHAPPPLLRGIYCAGATNEDHVSLTGSAPLVPVSVPLVSGQTYRRDAGEEHYSAAAQQIASWLQADLRIAFTQDLFLKKVFAERGLARPLARHFAVRDRLRVGLQIASGVTAAVLALGTALAVHRLSLDQQRLIPLLDNIEIDLNAPGAVMPGSRRVGADQFITDMAGFETQGFHSVFLPASWFDSIDHSIKMAMVPAFRVLVLEHFHQGLEQRITELTEASAVPLPDVPAISADHVVQPNQRLEQIPEYLQMQAFLQQADQLRGFVTIYNQLSTHNTSSPVDSIIQLDGYIERRQAQISAHAVANPYFDEAVRESVWETLPFDSARPRLSAKARQLGTNLYAAWILHNPVRTATEHLRDRVQALALPSRHTAQELADARIAFSTAARVYDQPELQWTAADQFVMPPELGAVTTSAFGNMAFFNGELRAEMLGTAEDDFTALSTAVDSAQTRLTGTLAHLEEGKLTLSQNAQSMQVALDNLLNLSFMADYTGSSGESVAAPRSFTWNKAALESAMALPGSYNSYVRQDLDQAPVALRGAFSRIASEQLAHSVQGAILAAMQPAPPITPDTGAEQLAQRAQDFSAAQSTLASLTATLQQAGLRGPLDLVRQSSVTQAGDLLVAYDHLLDRDQPYGVSTYAISRWTPGGMPAEEIYQVSSPDELAGYLALQRTTVTGLATAAAPVVEYLRSERTYLPARTARVLARWEALENAVQQYQAKRPGNSIQSLEDLIATGLDKYAAAHVCDASRLPALAPAAQDYFALENVALRREIVARCSAILLASFDQVYTLLASRFNRDLSGRFPFAPLDAPALIEADPSRIAGVYRLYAENADLLSANAEDAKPEAAQFLARIQGTRRWFAPVLGTAGADQLPSLEVLPAFRVDQEEEIGGNQIIEWTLQIGNDVIHLGDAPRRMRWTVGETVRFSFRWAKDAAYVPLPQTTQPYAGFRVLVAGDTVTYAFDDPWSLLRAIRSLPQELTQNGSLNPTIPFTLHFSIPEMPASSPSAKLQVSPTLRASVFVRLQLYAPGEKEALPVTAFPMIAPPEAR